MVTLPLLTSGNLAYPYLLYEGQYAPSGSGSSIIICNVYSENTWECSRHS